MVSLLGPEGLPWLTSTTSGLPDDLGRPVAGVRLYVLRQEQGERLMAPLGVAGRVYLASNKQNGGEASPFKPEEFLYPLDCQARWIEDGSLQLV